MQNSKSGRQGITKTSKLRLQVLAFIAILALPLLLYLAAQGGQPILIKILLGIMTMVMLLVIWIS